MRVFHDSRDCACRQPFGAVKVGGSVKLTIFVWDAPGSTAHVRTWVDGVGERRIPMDEAVRAAAASDAPHRFTATLQPVAAGIVWYQFVITDAEGRDWRYGARNGRLGGEGQLVDWEPPSFSLSVFDDEDMAPAWHEPVDGYLRDDRACHELSEVAAALCENYPVGACRTAAPFDLGDEALPAPAELPDIATSLGGCAPGAWSWFSTSDDVLGLWREGEGGSMFCVLMNASACAAHDVAVPLVRDEVSELVTGYGVDVVDAAAVDDGSRALFPDAPRFALVNLQPLASLVLHFHATRRLARPLQPGVGVLAHITSLPTEDGRFGTLGRPAFRFVDWLAQAGVRYWQVLPVNPTDACGSPYAGISAFAGNARLLEGGLPIADAELAACAGDEDYAGFCAREADWLEPYACFMAIRTVVGENMAWQEWPERYRRYSADLPDDDRQLATLAEQFRRTQFLFERQWGRLRAYANERGVQIVGDMPIYVSADSADVWAHPELFQLGEDGLPLMVAGCAPDAFAAEGQIWGNPVYDWDAMAYDGYAWWTRRLERAFGWYDFLRLDHFIGFSRYFSIPVGEKATAGAYRLGPGYAFFRMLYEQFGPLPIIAEDLGLITPRVRALVADCGFPGMDIVQFADGGDPLAHWTPRPEKVVYTGTHDNQTLRGFVQGRYPGLDDVEAASRLVDEVLACGAPVRILALQDVLALDDAARMNVPGTAEGNWAWQAGEADVQAASEHLKGLVER